MKDEDFMRMIDEAIKNYKGDGSYLNEAVGMLVVGRLLGWEHQRIVASRPCWTFATKVFGDPKLLLPRRGEFAYKSRALELADKFGGYLDILKGKVSLPVAERADRKLVI